MTQDLAIQKDTAVFDFVSLLVLETIQRLHSLNLEQSIFKSREEVHFGNQGGSNFSKNLDNTSEINH